MKTFVMLLGSLVELGDCSSAGLIFSSTPECHCQIFLGCYGTMSRLTHDWRYPDLARDSDLINQGA